MRKFDNYKNHGHGEEECCECGAEPAWLMGIDENDDCEIFLCKACLEKALEMLDGTPSP